MYNPLYYKYSLPIFVDKSESKIRQDKYEHYYPTILRNLIIHCGDHLWNKYPHQPWLDFILNNIPGQVQNFLEIGCGVGRILAEVAMKHPGMECFGIDYSLQMLICARKMWISGSGIEIDAGERGFSVFMSPQLRLKNVKFAQAKAEFIPWNNGELDVVVASFLLDKTENPELIVKEVYRILAPSGRFIIITPFNMEKRNLWEQYYPEEKFTSRMSENGFQLVKNSSALIEEPLDLHGNSIQWNCSLFNFKKEPPIRL